MTNGIWITTELKAIGRGTRRGILFSVVAHALLFMWLILYQQITPDPPGITEITWIEEAEAAPAAPPEVAAHDEGSPVEDDTPKMPTSSKSDDKFERVAPIADLAPDPQTLEAINDKMSERLAVLQKTADRKPRALTAVKTPSPIGRPKLAGVSDDARPTDKPTDLTRQQAPRPNPIQLQRSRPRPKVQAATVLSTPLPSTETERARPKDAESYATRQLAGATVTGPVADRKLLSYEKPVFPEWAKLEAVEGSVTLYFVVLPDGRVKENIMVEKTSGFGDFDTNATEALAKWRFEPLSGGAVGEQWGTITFNFRLSDTR